MSSLPYTSIAKSGRGVKTGAAGADPAKVAWELVITDVRIAIGPIIKDAFIVLIPSPVKSDAAIAKWTAWGGRISYGKGEGNCLLPFWIIPRRNIPEGIGMKELDALYRALYSESVMIAKQRLLWRPKTRKFVDKKIAEHQAGIG